MMDSNRVLPRRQNLSKIFTPAFLTIWLANFLFFTNLSSFYLLPLYIKSLGGTEAEIGLIMGGLNAVAIICQPLVGEWVDRAGRRPFMVLGATLSALASVSFAFTRSFGMFFFLRVVQGVALSSFFIASFTAIAGLVPTERRGQAMGIFGISGLLATALAPLAGEQIIRAFGFQVFFLGATAVVLAALIVTLRASVPSVTGVGPAAEPLTLAGRLMELTRIPMLVALVFGLGSGTLFIFLPTYAQSLGMRHLGLFYTAYAGTALLVRTVGGGLIDRRDRRQVVVPGMLMQLLGVGLLAAPALVPRALPLPLLSLFFVSGLLTGGAHGVLYPALSALLVERTTEGRRGRTVGIFSSAILIGNTVGAVLCGYVASGFGYGPMFIFLTMIVCAGFGVSLRLKPS